MTTSFRIAIARDPLLALAKSAGDHHSAGCVALLNLLHTSEEVGEKLRHELGHLQLSSVGFGILTLLASHPEAQMSTSQLAAALDRTAQSISHALGRLELGHFIERARNPSNRRQNLVQLTNLGRTTIHHALQEFETTIHRLMSAFTPEELTILQRSCNRLCPPTTLLSQ